MLFIKRDFTYVLIERDVVYTTYYVYNIYNICNIYNIYIYIYIYITT